MKIGQTKDMKTLLVLNTRDRMMKFGEVEGFVYLGIRITDNYEKQKEIETKLLKVNTCLRAIIS